MPMHAAEDFWRRFQSLYSKASPQTFGNGAGAAWTRGMYRLLHELKTDMSLHCECKSAHPDQVNTVRGERMHIDFFWYAKDSGDWARPEVVIEHENYKEGAFKDFWKVTLVDAPLRVFIGYAAREDGVVALFEQLRQTATDHHWGVPRGSADLVILGDYDVCARFRAWARTADNDWTSLGTVPAPSVPSRKASLERRPWSPNDIVRSIDAYRRVQEGELTLDAAAEELATAIGHTPEAARAAIEAVGNADPADGGGPGLIPFARVVAEHLLANPNELRRLIDVIVTRD